MGSATYRTQVIVLRKTKLGESDLILTMLAADGSQIRAVAKGARKPSSPFSSRLELYSQADVLIAGGRDLDIVKEARLERGNEHIRCDMEYAACAASMAELLDRITQLGLEIPKIFAMTATALEHLDKAEREAAPVIAAAHLMKAMSLAGYRPSLTTCVGCGDDVKITNGSRVHFSYSEGGVVCADCAPHVDTILTEASLCLWANILITSTFEKIDTLELDMATSFSILQFCQSWIRAHVGTNLKSLQFMFTSGIY